MVFVGAWKHHIGLYPIPALDDDLEAEVAPYRAAKDTVQFPYRDPIPYDLIERLVAASLRRIEGGGLQVPDSAKDGSGQANRAPNPT